MLTSASIESRRLWQIASIHDLRTFLFHSEYPTSICEFASPFHVLATVEAHMEWIELDWIGLDWIGLDWIGRADSTLPSYFLSCFAKELASLMRKSECHFQFAILETTCD
ncbi:hypothetical protein TcWFU_005930 [Taenia crassiceps]|uniref:Uncharacterized protein n=1 Tax=Taenia crassiceps TaxID=6207 RepID=A0ABR4Q4W2_9CEST